MTDEARAEISKALDFDGAEDPANPKINLYVCKECGHKTYTVDVARGTTSMVLPCMSHTEAKVLGADGQKAHACSGEMLSTFYSVDHSKVSLQDVKFEWRYATLPEYRDYRKRGQALADHVASGGLVLHRRSNPNAPVLTHGDCFVRPNGTALSKEEEASLETGLQVLKRTVRLDVAKAKKKFNVKKAKQDKDRASRRKKNKAKRKNRR